MILALFPDAVIQKKLKKYCSTFRPFQLKDPGAGVQIITPLPEIPGEWQGVAADVEGVSKARIIMDDDPCLSRSGRFIIRHLAGDQKHGTVNGERLREGYQNASKLDAVLFTPTTKAAIGGHDEAIDYRQTEALVGAETAKLLKDATIGLYTKAADYALVHGVIIADTKFEFGMDSDGSLILADEVLTPDSSRFWPKALYSVGKNPPSLDKQFVRDWLDSINFNHQPPGPVLPDDVINRTREIYVKAYEELSGRSFS